MHDGSHFTDPFLALANSRPQVHSDSCLSSLLQSALGVSPSRPSYLPVRLIARASRSTSFQAHLAQSFLLTFVVGCTRCWSSTVCPSRPSYTRRCAEPCPVLCPR